MWLDNLPTRCWTQPIIYQKTWELAVYQWHNLWALPMLGKGDAQSRAQAARAQLPSMGKPGLRRFCPGDAYRTRCQTVRWGAPVRARASPPPVVGCREAQSPVTVGTPPSSLTSVCHRLRLFSFV